MNWGYILCINNDLMELHTLANQLQEEFSRSHIVYKAENAEEATLIIDMLQAAHKRIELIICDQHMTGIQGVDFLDNIRQVNPEMMRLILINSEHDISSEYLLSRATIHNFIVKPWKREHLILIVETLLKLYRMAQHLEELEEISLQFGPIFDLAALLKRAIRYIEEMTSARRVGIALTEANSRQVMLYLSNTPGHQMTQQAVDQIDRLFQEIMATRKEVLVFNNAYDNAYLQQFQISDLAEANHVVYVPLWRNEAFLGGMYVADKDSGLPFFREDIISIKIIALQLISKVENIRLTEEKLRLDRITTVGNMAGEIIHDLKGPMTTILGFAELLEQGASPQDEQRNFSRIIVSEIENMMEMVEEILEFSRGDKMTLNLRPCDVVPLVEEVTEVIRRNFQAQHIHLMTKLSCTRTIYADREKLKRVFYNIANNAKDALQPHGKFSINTYLHNNTHVEFRLADSGVGIPTHVKENIFEPFVTYGKKRGTGLGMSIAKKIIIDHGGEIWVESEEGKGTIFYFTVPLFRAG
jgi:signal transduction histidine kinase